MYLRFNGLHKRRIILKGLYFVSSFVLIGLVHGTSLTFYQLLFDAVAKDEEDFTDGMQTLSSNTEPYYIKCSNKFEILKQKNLNKTYNDVIIERHPNLPNFLLDSKLLSSSIPDVLRIRWTGTVYQQSWNKSPKFLLYSAHFDNRQTSDILIHILSLYDGEKVPNNSELKQNICQIYFNTEDSPTIVPLYQSIMISNLTFSKKQLNPFALSCKVPKYEISPTSYPIAVSLVRQHCQTPTNILKISGSPFNKKKKLLFNSINVGICGKVLSYQHEDFSIRLIEWIETMKALGASKIFLYQTKYHEKIQKVLNYYEKIKMVKLMKFYYPPPIVQEKAFVKHWFKIKKTAYRSAQNIYINDCLLRNKDDFDYLGVFDSDEVPILRNHSSFQALLNNQRFENKMQPESYFLKWKTFFKDLYSSTPSIEERDYSYIFSHNIRTKLKAAEEDVFETNGKTFYDTKQVTWANPYKHLDKLGPKVKLKTISRKIAYIGHFVNYNCSEIEYCSDNDMEEETALLSIKDKVLREMKSVLQILKL